MSDESYYRVLAVMDRIHQRGKEIKNLSQVARDAGLHEKYIHQNNYKVLFPLLSNLLRLANALNVSVEYLLTGRNKQAYSPLEVSFEKIMNLKSAPGKIFSDSLTVIKRNIKLGKTKDIHLKTAFDFEQVSGVPVAKLFFKEKCNG